MRCELGIFAVGELAIQPHFFQVGLSALQIAAQCNQLEVVETLCDSKKVDIDFHKEV